MIPIRDAGGQVVAFAGRYLTDEQPQATATATSTQAAPVNDATTAKRIEEEKKKKKFYNPKYLNSAQTSLFKKGSILFGLDLARNVANKKRELILVNIPLLAPTLNTKALKALHTKALIEAHTISTGCFSSNSPTCQKPTFIV